MLDVALASSAWRLVAGLTLLLLLLLPAPAEAATFTVDGTNDAVDANTGDGICATTSLPVEGVRCTLRAAVMEANALRAAGDTSTQTIILQARTYMLSIPNDAGPEQNSVKGDLDLIANIHLDGAGAGLSVIDGGNGGIKDRVIDVQAGAIVTISRLTIRGGRPEPFEGEPNGGGIRNSGNATLSQVTVSENFSVSAIRGQGGGIDNSGTLQLIDSTVSRNRNDSGGSRGAKAFGGGIYNTGVLDIRNSTVVGNVAQSSPIPAGGRGGGVHNLGALTMLNSTINGNQAGDGEAIYNESPGTASLTNVTVTNHPNHTYPLVGGVTITATNTILSNGLANCYTPITSGGHNIQRGYNTCGFDPAKGDILTDDPLLAQLADNGGPTQTDALLPGSMAIDAGDPAACPSTDQRVLPRPRDGDDVGGAGCDIGAFELQDPYRADLAIAAADTPDPATAGGQVSYGITVANSGPDRATGVVVNAPVPSGATFVSATSSQGNCAQASGTVTCQLGALDPSAQATVTVVVTATQVGTLSFAVTVANSGGQVDPTPDNNQASATTTVQTAPQITSCSPRPRAVVQAQPAGVGRIRAAFTATTNAGQSQNVIGSVQITQANNATVDVPVQPGIPTAQNGLGSGQQIVLSPLQPTVYVYVQRSQPGPFTAHFLVGDGCTPAWSTFVGGGAGVP
jgi:uncharacterized repeat protein (TIGR01451 family)